MRKRDSKEGWQISKYFILRCAGFPFELMEKLKFRHSIRTMNDFLKHKSDGFKVTGQARKIFEREFYEKRLQLQEISNLPKFQEAVFLQDMNSDAFRSISKFSHQKLCQHKRNNKDIDREFLIYKYLQRFCTKNETVSFFGPFYIGEFRELKTKIQFDARTSGFSGKRNIYTTFWFLYHIIDAIEADDKILVNLQPRLPPNLYFNNKLAVILKTNGRLKLDRLTLEILTLADYKSNVKNISLELMKKGFGEAEIFGKIRWMFKNSLLLSGLEFNQNTANPEEYLLEKLKNIPGAENNEWHLKLKKLTKLKAKFKKGNFIDRKRIYDEIMSMFHLFMERGYNKSRFFGRGIFTEYRELGFRDLRLDKTVSGNFLQSFNFVLNMVSCNFEKLKSIESGLLIDFLKRNFRVNTVGVKEVLFKLSQEQAKGKFLCGNLEHHFGWGGLPADFAAFLDRYKDKKSVILNRESLMRMFQRYLEVSVSPAATCCDCLLSARSLAEINKGKFEFIFGESHVMRKPTNIFASFAECSSKKIALRREIAKMQNILIGDRFILGDFLKIPKDILEKNYDSGIPYEVEFDAYSDKRQGKINFSELKIVFDKERAYLVDSKNRPVLLLEDLPSIGSLFSVSAPSLKSLRQAEESTHFPRAALDNLVLQREQWVFLKKEIFFTQEKYKRRGLELWLELEKWRRKQGIPKHIFLRADNRIKPIFIDFENYFAIEAFINFVKRAKKSISIEEMLPGPEGLWFKDKDGRYTCEFRLILYKKANHPGLADNCPPGKSHQNS